LNEVAGVGDVTITQLKLIAAAASHIAKGQLQQSTPFLRNSTQRSP
jgi:DNA repair protein RadC